MILSIIFLAKVLLVLGATAFIVRSFRKQMPKLVLWAMTAGILICAVAANHVASFLPPMTDIVTLTALGEKQAASGGMEVYLSGYTVDGEKFVSGKSLEIKEGHWFWSGETYAWRPETDTRQPDGVTRTVVLEIPVGWNRTLDFSSNQWRGKVEICAGGETWVIDTYSEKGGTVSEPIAQSQDTVLNLNQLRYFVLFVVLLTVVIAVAFAIARRLDVLSAFIKRNRWPLIYAAISIAQLLLAMKYAGIDCFWLDELIEIAWSTEANNLLERMFIGYAPLPIYYLFLHLWYSIAPYGEAWLLLPMEIATAIGIFFTGLIARECAGNHAGLFSSAFVAVSYHVMYQCSYEIRSYAFYFMFAAILLFLYIKRLKMANHESGKIIAMLSIAMLLFAGMHYHAVVQCIMLFIVDCMLALKKRIRLRCFLPYFVAGASYIPNVIYIISTHFINNFRADGWQPVPGIGEVNKLFLKLAGNSEALIVLFLVSVSIITAVMYANYTEKKEKEIEEEFLCKVPLFIVVGVLSFFIIYGNYINPKASLWNERYFVDLIPSFYVLCGIGAASLSAIFSESIPKNRLYKTSVFVFLLLLIIPSSLGETVQTAKKVRQPYRQAADWIYTQSNTIFNENTLILTTDWPDVVPGWMEYYVQRQGRRDPLLVISQEEIGDELLNYDRIYLMALHRSSPKSDIKTVLNQSYSQVEKNDYFTVYQRK